MPFSSRTAVLSLLLLCSPVFVIAQKVEITDRTFKSQRLNELGLWDLGNDGRYELFITTVAGKAGCYNADTLETLWEHSVTDQSLTAPVVGDFMRTGAPILAFGSGSGEIFFLWPATGQIIAVLPSDMQFIAAPAIMQIDNGDDLVMVGSEGQLALFYLDESGTPQMRHLIPNTLPATTAFSVVGRISHPVSTGDLNGDGIPEIVAISDSGVIQIVTFPPDAEPVRYYTRLAQQSRATTIAGLGPLGTTSDNLFLYGVDASLHLFRWQPDASPDKAIQPFLQTPAFGNTSGHLLIGKLNDDESPDLLHTAHNTIGASYLGRDYSGKDALLDIANQHLTTTLGPFSTAVAMTVESGAQAVLAVDHERTASLWVPFAAGETKSQFAQVPYPTTFSPAGNLDGSGNLTMIIWNDENFTLSSVKFPVKLARSDVGKSGPFLTMGVNYARNGHWDSRWASEWNARLDAARRALENARSVTGEAAPGSPVSSESIIAGIDPGDPLSLAYRKKTYRNSGSILLILGGLLVIVLAGAAARIVSQRRKN